MKKNNKPIAIYQDQRIAEEWCNFRCEYCEGFCPTDYSLKKDEKGNLHVAEEWFDMIKKCRKMLKNILIMVEDLKNFMTLQLQL